MMTRKHYTAIAAVLAGDLATAGLPDGTEAQKVRKITLSLADVFKGDNPNFNRAKFYEAVGLTSEGFLK